VRWRAALVAALLCACGGRKESPEAGGPAGKESQVTEPAADEGGWLLVEKHGDQAARASYVAIDLAAAGPQPISLGDAPALARSDWQGHFRTVVAHGGPIWVRGEEKGGRHALVVSDARGGAPRSIEVDAAPTSLHLYRSALWVGLGQRLGWIDLGAARPTFQELVARDHQFKAYDLFARTGDRLVAIDDVVMPMVADWFALDGKAPRRLGDWRLPGVINGHYAHAALVPAGQGSWTLYLIAPYGIMDGSGHDLAAVPVRGDKLVFEEGLTLQNGRGGATPILEEHVDRGTGKPVTLVAGSEVTDWTGLAVDPDGGRLLIAAGKRGLIVLPGDFKSDSKGVLVDLGGECRDVAMRAGAPVALVAGAQASELILLTRSGDGYTAGTRHRLPDAFDRILD
jgi:hypothetical protein